MTLTKRELRGRAFPFRLETPSDWVFRRPSLGRTEEELIAESRDYEFRGQFIDVLTD